MVSSYATGLGMADQISICNMALAEIVAEPIESLSERSLGARECGRYYSQALNSLLESHPWGFAIQRAGLAPTINTRPAEWPAAFALPNDVARPVKVVPASLVNGVSAWWFDDRVPSVSYAIEGGILFCATGDAVLAYVRTSVTADAFPSRFVDAFALELATRIVMPIKKSREQKGDLLRLAEIAKQRAMADDINRQPAPEGVVQDTWVDQVQRVRNGGWSDHRDYYRR